VAVPRIVDDRSGLEIIPPDECLTLLASAQVGRLAFSLGGAIDLLPVNYALLGRDVVIRTAAGAKWRDGPGASAAFEVDELQPDLRTGWSVVVHGRLEPFEGEAPDGLQPWAPSEKPYMLRLVSDTITGRRIA
jgi:hypothetical protein